jgi:hypothetical protein
VGAEDYEIVDEVEATTSNVGVGVLSVHTQRESYDVRDVAGGGGADISDVVLVRGYEGFAHIEDGRRERLAGLLEQEEGRCRSVGEGRASGKRGDEAHMVRERLVTESVEGALGGIANLLFGVVECRGDDGDAPVSPRCVGDVVGEDADSRGSAGVIRARQEDVYVVVEAGVVVGGERELPGGDLPCVVARIGEHLSELLCHVRVTPYLDGVVEEALNIPAPEESASRFAYSIVE